MVAQARKRLPLHMHEGMYDFFKGSLKGPNMQMPLQQGLVCQLTLWGSVNKKPPPKGQCQHASLALLAGSLVCLQASSCTSLPGKIAHQHTNLYCLSCHATWTVGACWQSCYLALVQT